MSARPVIKLSEAVSCVTRVTAHSSKVELEALYPLAVSCGSSSLGFVSYQGNIARKSRKSLFGFGGHRNDLT
jgi:hypothetical protein